MTTLTRRVEWRVYIEPWPTERWEASTVRAVDEDHAQALAAHRKFARITRITTTETTEEIEAIP